MRTFLLALLLGLFAGNAPRPVYHRYEVIAQDPKELQILVDSELNLSEEAPALGRNVALIRPGEERQLRRTGLRHRYLDTYRPEIPSRSGESDADYRNQWLRYDEILQEWDGLLAQYPEFVRRRTIGVTHEG